MTRAQRTDLPDCVYRQEQRIRSLLLLCISLRLQSAADYGTIYLSSLSMQYSRIPGPVPILASGPVQVHRRKFDKGELLYGLS